MLKKSKILSKLKSKTIIRKKEGRAFIYYALK